MCSKQRGGLHGMLDQLSWRRPDTTGSQREFTHSAVSPVAPVGVRTTTFKIELLPLKSLTKIRCS